MLSIGLVAIIILSIGATFVILLKRVPSVRLVSESQLGILIGKGNRYKRIIRFIGSKQKIITVVLLTKAIRKLKVISLKTDNLATLLLSKIRSYGEGEK